IFKALAVVLSAVTLPATVVTNFKSNDGSLIAIVKAAASSIPGSVSIIIFVVIILSPFYRASVFEFDVEKSSLPSCFFISTKQRDQQMQLIIMKPKYQKALSNQCLKRCNRCFLCQLIP